MTFGKCPDRSQSLPTRAIDCIRHCLLSIERFPIGCYRNPTRFLQENRWRTSRRWRKPQRKPRRRRAGRRFSACPRGGFRGGRSPDSRSLDEHPLEAALFRGRWTVVQRRVSGQGSLDGSLPSRQTETANRSLGREARPFIPRIEFTTIRSADPPRQLARPKKRKCLVVSATQRYGRDGAQAARICNPGAREPTLALRWKGLLGP